MPANSTDLTTGLAIAESASRDSEAADNVVRVLIFISISTIE